MANYKITPVETPELDSFSNFDDLLRSNLTASEIKKILEFLSLYFSSEVFKEHGAVEFRYFPTAEADSEDAVDIDEDTPYRFLISRDGK